MDCTHIVVGSGSSGCVVAARLAEDSRNSVVLIEAGGRDWHPLIHIPLGMGRLLFNGLYNWNYSTEPQPSTKNRSIPWLRGKVLGGCSSINGMVFMRGQPADYDAWADQGNEGWSFADVFPYFKKAEGHVDRADAFHGQNGPVKVSTVKSGHPIDAAIVRSGSQAGYEVTSDFNGRKQEGFGYFDFNINRGRRVSSAKAYLDRKRVNLRIITNAHVTKVLFDGTRAMGVEYMKNGKLQSSRASSEIVISAGVMNTPQILMLSGIGDGQALSAMGIPVVSDLPGVGKNIQDHAGMHLLYTCPLPLTTHSLLRVDRAAAAMIQASVFRTGPASMMPTAVGAVTRSSPDVNLADLMLHYYMGLGIAGLRIPYIYPFKRTIFDQEGFRFGAELLQPRSRGEIRLRNGNPFTPPIFLANDLTDDDDVRVLRAGFRQIREVMKQPAIQPFIKEEIAPGSEINSDDEVDDWMRGALRSMHHQVGSCRMGNDRMAVLDSELRVRGVTGLRVADASIMPTHVRANTHAPCLMIGEKAADLIMGRQSISPENPYDRERAVA